MSQQPDDGVATAGTPSPTFRPDALNSRFGPRHTWQVRPGQVWRATGGSVALLVLVVSAGTTDARVVPVTLDGGFENRHCLIAGHGQTSFTADVTFWTDLASDLPLLALDRPVDEVSEDVLDAVRHGGPVDAPARWGRQADPDGVDDEYRAELVDELEMVATSTSIQDLAVGDASGRFQPTQEQLERLIASTGLGLPTVLAIGDGKADVPVGHTEAFRAVLGFLPRAQPLPGELVAEVTHPANRAVVLSRVDARSTAAQAAKVVCREVLALAARQTGRNPVPDWGQRLRRWAEIHHVPGPLR